MSNDKGLKIEKQEEPSACSGCLKCESYRTSFENDFDDVHVEYGYCSLWLHSIVTTTEKKDRKVPIVLYEEFQQGFMNIVQQKSVEKMQNLQSEEYPRDFKVIKAIGL